MKKYTYLLMLLLFAACEDPVSRRLSEMKAPVIVAAAGDSTNTWHTTMFVDVNGRVEILGCACFAGLQIGDTLKRPMR